MRLKDKIALITDLTSTAFFDQLMLGNAKGAFLAIKHGAAVRSMTRTAAVQHAGDESSSITGVEILVDGGLTAV